MVSIPKVRYRALGCYLSCVYFMEGFLCFIFLYEYFFAMPDLNFYCAINVWYLLPLHGIEGNNKNNNNNNKKGS